MPLQFNNKFSFEDEQVQRFLFDETQSFLKIEPTLETDFYYPVNHIKDPIFNGETLNVVIQVLENWGVYKRLSPWLPSKTKPDHFDKYIGNQQVTVIKGLDVKINVSYYLSLNKNINQNDVQDDLNTLKNFVPNSSDVTDFEQYISNSLTTLTTNDFNLSTCIIIEKYGDGKLQDIQTQQRDELKRTYEKIDNNGRITAIDLETTLAEKSKDEGIFLWLDGEELKTKEIPNPLPSASYKATDLPTESWEEEAFLTGVITGPLSPILDKLLPKSCGEMERKEHKLFTLVSWPEFMLEFKEITIRIGCVQITVTVPVIKTRTSKIFFYVYFSVFVDAGKSAKRIAERCALKAAIEGSVVGLITLNPGVALAEFLESFKQCIIKDILSCTDAGIFTIKFSTDWA